MASTAARVGSVHTGRGPRRHRITITDRRVFCRCGGLDLAVTDETLTDRMVARQLCDWARHHLVDVL